MLTALKHFFQIRIFEFLFIFSLGLYQPWSNVRFGLAMASKQSAQERYVVDIAVVNCSNRHASVGKWV